MDKGPEELIVIILKGSTLDEEVFEYCTVQHVEGLAFFNKCYAFGAQQLFYTGYLISKLDPPPKKKIK